jgi:hypothetical protein
MSDAMNGAIRRASGRLPAEPEQPDDAPPPAASGDDIDAGARSAGGPVVTDMNRALRRAAGREPAITHSDLLRGL